MLLVSVGGQLLVLGNGIFDLWHFANGFVYNQMQKMIHPSPISLLFDYFCVAFNMLSALAAAMTVNMSGPKFKVSNIYQNFQKEW